MYPKKITQIKTMNRKRRYTMKHMNTNKKVMLIKIISYYFKNIKDLSKNKSFISGKH